MDTALTVRPENLSTLTPEDAVLFFRDLVWSSARRHGVPISRIHVSARTDVPDGGVDAAVEAGTVVQTDGVIRDGYTCFQIKQGASFKPWQESEIKEELFGRGKPVSASNLGAGVKRCVEQNGTFVIVLFGSDPVEATQRQKAVDLTTSLLSKCGYLNVKVEVWGQSHLIGLVQAYPSLALRLNQRGSGQVVTLDEWASEAEMRRAFVRSAEQDKLVEDIRARLRQSGEAIHLRVLGEPGIGKTRLVLQALSDPDLAPLVLYYSAASLFRNSTLMNEMRKTDSHLAAIVVIDECDVEGSSYVWNVFRHLGDRVKIVSIYNEADDTSGSTVPYWVPPLSREETEKIIEGYGVSHMDADRWAALCDGSPRVAHVIGQNLRENPDDLLKTPDTVEVWTRYVCGSDDRNGVEVAERRLVLEHVALFKRFGYGAAFLGEAKAISALVERANPLVTWDKFCAVIESLRRRKILQGEYTCYITPKALHIWLWISWWKNHRVGFDYSSFIGPFPTPMREWFNEMMEYAASSADALDVVRSILSDAGPFADKDFLKKKGAPNFFLALTNADPKSALACLTRVFDKWTDKDFLSFTEGRQDIVWAIERMAVWDGLFVGAARLLLRLAEFENETRWSNNASGMFAGLFSNGYGLLATSEASPETRFVVIREAVESDLPARRALGLSACEHALVEVESRAIGAERQGLRQPPKLWRPTGHDDFVGAYTRVWGYLAGRVGHLEGDERGRAVSILVERGLDLARHPVFAPTVLETLKRLVADGHADKEMLLPDLIRFTNLLDRLDESYSEDMRKAWLKFKGDLVGTGFSSRLHRFVGLVTLDDDVDQDAEVGKLVDETIADPTRLDAELPWLLSDRAKGGYKFGHGLGRGDTKGDVLAVLLGALRKSGTESNVSVVCGYLRAMHDADVDKWEALLKDVSADDGLVAFVPNLIWGSGMTPVAAGLMTGLVANGRVSKRTLYDFCYGAELALVPEGDLTAWLKALASGGDPQDAVAALRLAHSYFVWKKEGKSQMPRDIVFGILTHESVVGKSESRKDATVENEWEEVALAALGQYPEVAVDLAAVIVADFGNAGSVFSGYHPLAGNVLTTIAKAHPTEVWRLIEKELGGHARFQLTTWLKGSDMFRETTYGRWSIFPPDLIWGWVDADVDKRAWYVAYNSPKDLFREDGVPSFSREVLVRYGSREDVRRNMGACYSSEGWSGPGSTHFASKKEKLLSYRSKEKDRNVIQWIDEYVESLDEEIRREIIEEERGDR